MNEKLLFSIIAFVIVMTTVIVGSLYIWDNNKEYWVICNHKDTPERTFEYKAVGFSEIEAFNSAKRKCGYSPLNPDIQVMVIPIMN